MTHEHTNTIVLTCTRRNVNITAAHGFPRRVVPWRIQRSNGPKTNSSHFISFIQMKISPNISSIAKASNILDAPISPDKHAEKTADIIPIMTNGVQILTSCKNK